jgi:hypothetical protein
MSITLVSYTSKYILLINGFIFSVSLGHDEHLRVFEYPVALWPVINADRDSSHHRGSYVLLIDNNRRTETIFNQIKCWETNKIQLCLLC